MSSKENADEDVGEEVDPKKLEEENYEDVLTLSDIVELNDNLENQAEALLGGQNDMVCTYPEVGSTHCFWHIFEPLRAISFVNRSTRAKHVLRKPVS